MVPIATGDPTTFRNLRRKRLDPRGKLLRRISIAQVDARELKTAAEKMRVRVVETGQEQTLMRVDDARVWTSKFPDVVSRADGDDTVRVGRHGFGGWLRRVHRVDDGVDDDGVGHERRFVSVNGKIHKTQGQDDARNQQGRGFHQRQIVHCQ